MSKKLHILINGTSGFIGSNLIHFFEEYDLQTTSISSVHGDIRTIEYNKLFSDSSYTHFIYLAGKTKVPESWNAPKEYIDVNFNGLLNAIEFCRLKNIHLVYISSYVYGTVESNPINENFKLQANNPYGISKLLCENLCEFYRKTWSIPITVIRPFNIYGPGQSSDMLIPTIICQALNSNQIILRDLNPKRDFIYIKDLCELLLHACQLSEGGVYNAGSGLSYSVKEVVELIQKISGTNKEVVSENLVRKNEIDNCIADISKVSVELSWSPKFSLEEGLRETIAYYKAQSGS